jgi:hypothetical protein
MELVIPFKKFKEHLPSKEHIPHEGVRYALAIKSVMKRRRSAYSAIVIVYAKGGTVKYSF